MSVPRLFVYGSLQPGGANEHVLNCMPGEFTPAVVRGRLRASGWGAAIGYPGIELRDDGDPVPGFVFESEHLAKHWQRLDEFEGVEYARAVTTATLPNGTTIDVQVYVLLPEPS